MQFKVFGKNFTFYSRFYVSRKRLICCSIEYEASLVGEHNFKILCHVEKLKKPIKVMIMAQVKEVMSTVMYKDSEGLEMKVDELSCNSIQLNGV